jgi:hypothetical protein
MSSVLAIRATALGLAIALAFIIVSARGGYGRAISVDTGEIAYITGKPMGTWPAHVGLLLAAAAFAVGALLDRLTGGGQNLWAWASLVSFFALAGVGGLLSGRLRVWVSDGRVGKGWSVEAGGGEPLSNLDRVERTRGWFTFVRRDGSVLFRLSGGWWDPELVRGFAARLNVTYRDLTGTS